MRALLYPYCLFLLVGCAATRRSAPPVSEAQRAQAELSREYLDPETSILSAEQRRALEANGGLNFFPIDAAYRVEAKVNRPTDRRVISMPTSSERIVEYEVFALLTFSLHGVPDTLEAYASTDRYLPEEYRNLLFVPFRDRTSGTDTYGGGRYLDLAVPAGDTLVLDFNLAYHPYCAYTNGYSCPVPPAANYLDQRVEAGVRNTDLGQ